MERKYNCFVYALGLNNDPDFTFENNLLPKIYIDGHRMGKILNRFSRTISPIEGDIVIYRSPDGYVNHASIFIDSAKSKSIWMDTEQSPSEKLISEEALRYGENIEFYKFPGDINLRSTLASQ